ncbi:MAG: alkaline phosphatase family protein, partial [Bacteroidota bacterium]
MKKHQLLLCLVLLTTELMAQNSLLQSGPMLGYSEMTEVLLWVQTKEAAKVQFEYWSVDHQEKKFSTTPVTTDHTTAFTAKVVADQVEPGQTYAYQLLINGQRISLPYPTTFQSQTLWQWRADPPSFTLALGSCFYINETKYDRPG